jgi:hypothetical protein
MLVLSLTVVIADRMDAEMLAMESLREVFLSTLMVGSFTTCMEGSAVGSGMSDITVGQCVEEFTLMDFGAWFELAIWDLTLW